MFFCKFFKFAALGIVTAGGVGYLLFGDSLGSYLSTMASSVRDSVKGQVPVEFELKRAEQLIRAIEPQMTTCKRELAQAEVNLENLSNDVARLEKEVVNGEHALKSGTAVLVAANGADLRLVGNGASRQRSEIELERRFQQFKSNKEVLRAKKVLIDHQTRAVTAARDRLDRVRSEKARLEDMVTMLKTQKVQIDALAASATTIQLDDSALSRAKQVLAEVKNRLDVAQKMIEDEMSFADGAEVAADRDVVLEIQKYFAEAEAAPVVIEVGASPRR
jgi:chromosome segregation ATPase